MMATIANSPPSLRAGQIKAAIIAGLVLTIYLEVFVSRAANLPTRTILDGIVIFLAAFVALSAFLRQKLQLLHAVLLLNIFVFTVISMLGELRPSFTESLISAIIFSKFILVFVLAPKFRMNELRPAIKILALVHVIGCAAQLIFPEFFNSLLPQLSYELDTSRLMGFTLNANRSAAVSSILLLYFLFYERRPLLVLLFLVLITLSGSRSLTMILALLTSYHFFQSEGSISKKFVAISVTALVATSLAVTMISLEDTSQIVRNTVFGDLRYIRAGLLKGGYSLANQFFPFGVGGGLFGSSMSEGSAAYRMVGIGHWATVIDMTGVYDSGLGSILGEYGYFGLLSYAVIVFITLKNARGGRVQNMMALFLLTLIIFMSFFRTVASDFFFSFFFLYCYAFLIDGRREKARI